MHRSVFSLILILAAQAASAQGFPMILDAKSCGVRADGVTDDGPAIRRMLERARRLDGPVTLRFPEMRTIHVATGDDRYVFRVDGMRGLTIDGGGSTFLLHKDLRFLMANFCRDLAVLNLNLDLTPSPVVEATVLAVEAGNRALKVRLDEPERAGELGGPTDEDGEQDYFGMLWFEGRHAVESEHYYVVAVEPGEEPGVVGVRRDKPLSPRTAERIQPGRTRISLPVPGIAHRYGPGPMVRVDRCDGVTVRNVEVWASPWFAFQVLRNDGDLLFQRVHIRPRPGGNGITSCWRDGFHVKGNRGSLLFEGCILEGMNDDAFNVSSHAWRVTELIAPDSVRIRQLYPKQMMAFQQGGELLILTPDATRRLGSARILKIEGLPARDAFDEHTLTPELTLTLDRAVEGLGRGCLMWDLTTANPRTTIRNCKLAMSCRLQSPGITVEDCDVSALLYFYSGGVEGPMPSRAVVRNCVLRQGRGNPARVLAFIGWREQPPATLPPPEAVPLRDVVVENNQFYGDLVLSGVAGAVLSNNRFHDGAVQVQLSVGVKQE